MRITYGYTAQRPETLCKLVYKQPPLLKRIYWNVTDSLKTIGLLFGLALSITGMLHPELIVRLIEVIL